MSFKIPEGLKKGDTVEVLLRGEVTAIGTNRTSGDWFDLGDMFNFEVTDNLVVSVGKVQPSLPTTPGSVVRLPIVRENYLLANDGEWRRQDGSTVRGQMGSADNFDIIYDAGKTS